MNFERRMKDSIKKAYKWVSYISISELEVFFNNSLSHSIIFIGTGGSYVVANLLKILSENENINSNATTPLLFLQRGIIKNESIFLLTSGGDNPDSIEVVRRLVKAMNNQALVFTLSPESPVSNICSNNKHIINFSRSVPFSLESFVAIEGLIAPALLMAKAFHVNIEAIVSSILCSIEIDHPLDFVSNFTSIFVLHGRNGEPAALNIEFKISKGGLGHIQKADFRSFSHGRYNYLTTFSNTLIVSIYSWEEKELACSTLKFIPKFIPRVIIESKYKNSDAAIDLLLKSFILIENMSLVKNVILNQVPDSAYKFGNELYKGSIWNDEIFKKY